jgi:hypothetical protein
MICPVLLVEKLSLIPRQYVYCELSHSQLGSVVSSLSGVPLVLFLDEFDTSFVGYFPKIEVVLSSHGKPLTDEALHYGTLLLQRRFPVGLVSMYTAL